MFLTKNLSNLNIGINKYIKYLKLLYTLSSSLTNLNGFCSFMAMNKGFYGISLALILTLFQSLQ